MATASAVPRSLFLPNFQYPTTLYQIKLKSLQTPLRILPQKSNLSSNVVNIKTNFVENTQSHERGVKRIHSSRRLIVRSMGSDSSVASTGLPSKAKN